MKEKAVVKQGEKIHSIQNKVTTSLSKKFTPAREPKRTSVYYNYAF